MWLSELRLADAGGDVAQRELRELLVAGLTHALGSRGIARDVCEDFAQEALLRIREKLGSFRGDSSFTTWALAIAVRIAFDELRRKRWKDVSLDDVTHASAFVASQSSSNDKRIVREQVVSELRRAVDGLTEKQRTLLHAELEGMPQAEIAVRMGMTRNAVYKLAHDSRRKLKQRLIETGITSSDALWAFD